MASEPRPTRSDDGPRALIGRLGEYDRLLRVLDTQPGLLAVAADPLSGTTGVIRAVLPELEAASIYVDTRGLLDETYLAMAIADATVTALRPGARAWWMGTSAPGDRAGLQLRQALSSRSIDLEDLRLGAGPGSRLLEIAFLLAVELANASVVVALDHLDDLAGRRRKPDPDPLGAIRAASQAHMQLQLVLVGRTDGPIQKAIHDRHHPLFQAGQLETIRRAEPSRFVDDLAVGRPWTRAPVELIRAAADLASGVPAYTWTIVDLAADYPDMPAPQSAAAAWGRLRTLTEAHTARQFDLLRDVHPVAQTVVAAVSAGLGAYSLPINDGRVRAALQALREAGAAWQPRERDWAIADPLLAAWARSHAPAWVRRRDGAAMKHPSQGGRE